MKIIYLTILIILIPVVAADEVQWNDVKTISHAKLNLTAPRDFTTCVISPDSGSGWDTCTAYIIINNNFQKLPPGIMNFNTLWRRGNVGNMWYEYTKDIIDSQIITPYFNMTANEWQNISTPAKVFAGFSPTLPDVEKGETFAVRITFEKKRWASDFFDFKVTAGGDDIVLDPDVGACGTLNTQGATYTLNQSVSANGTCFTISADDIIFDGGNYTVTFANVTSPTNGFAISVGNGNITIKNTKMQILNTTNSGGTGINDNGIGGNTFQDVEISIRTASTIRYAISLSSTSSGNYILNATTLPASTGAGGITISSDNNRIEGGSIYSGGGSAYDFVIGNGALNNTVQNPNFTTRRISFGNSLSEFNYTHRAGAPWLQNTISTGKIITRTINAWSGTNVSLTDSITSGGATINYNLSGLHENRAYTLVNGTTSSSGTAGADGKLNFTIGHSTLSRFVSAYIPMPVSITLNYGSYGEAGDLVQIEDTSANLTAGDLTGGSTKDTFKDSSTATVDAVTTGFDFIEVVIIAVMAGLILSYLFVEKGAKWL